MATNKLYSGVPDPVGKQSGFLWYADASSNNSALKTSVLNVETPLDEITGLTSAGSISTDGITIAENASEGDTFPDMGREILDRSESTIDPNIAFALHEGVGVNAQRLVFRNVEGTPDGKVNKIKSFAGPTDKFLVVEYLIKDSRVRIILPQTSYISREDFVISTEEAESWSVSYSILADADGDDFIKLVGDHYNFEVPEGS